MRRGHSLSGGADPPHGPRPCGRRSQVPLVVDRAGRQRHAAADSTRPTAVADQAWAALLLLLEPVDGRAAIVGGVPSPLRRRRALSEVRLPQRKLGLALIRLLAAHRHSGYGSSHRDRVCRLRRHPRGRGAPTTPPSAQWLRRALWFCELRMQLRCSLRAPPRLLRGLRRRVPTTGAVDAELRRAVLGQSHSGCL